jgi:hypothetical protein
MAGEKGSGYADSLLALIFNATTYATIAQNATSSPLTNLYCSLHTADPTSAGTQSSSEVAYTSYARVAVARTSGGFTVSGNSVSPAANISFPSCTGGTATATNWAIGVASSGATQLLYTGPISPTISISSGVVPTLLTSSTITES